MEPQLAIQSLLARQPLSDLIPYMAFDEKRGIYYLDTGIGFIFECQPLAFIGSDTALILKGIFESSQLPPGSAVQFMIYASPNIKHLLDGYVFLRESALGESLYTTIAKGKRKYLEKGVKENIFHGQDVKVRNFRLFCSVITPLESKTPENYGKLASSIERVKETVKQTLNTMGLYPEALPPEKLIDLCSEILNPSHDEQFGLLHYDKNIPMKDQILFADTEIVVEKDYMKVDQKICKSYTFRQYPGKWDIQGVMNFLGDMFENSRQIPVPFFITTSVEIPDVVKATAQIQKKAVAAGYQAYGPLARLFPRLGLKKENFDLFVAEMESGAKPVYAYHNFFTYASTREQAAEVDGILMSTFRSMNLILQEDSYILLPMFMMSLPMGYMREAQRDLRRRKTFTTSSLSELIPLQSDWKGSGEPVVPLISRRGQLQFIDIFYNPAGGFSATVSAATGAGKSFFVNELIMSYLGIGSRVWVVDVGRSYEKICNFVGGDFIVFEKESKNCINPFSKIQDLRDEMPLLKSVIAQMVSRAEALDDLRLSYIEEAIQDCYAKKGTRMTVTDVAMFLSVQKDSRQTDLARTLYPYTKDGAYASFFEGESNLSPTQNFVVMDLDELRSKKDLQEVVLLTLIYQIQQEIAKDRMQRKIVVVDEAWDLLTGGNTTTFLENGYRRFRKYRGACISITQSVNDFYKHPSGRAILENSDFFFLLRQRAESIEALKESKRVVLSEGMYELLKSVHTDSGNYSEIFIYAPTGIAIGRLSVDRFTQLLYSTKAEEYARVRELVAQGKTVIEAIREIIEREKRTGK